MRGKDNRIENTEQQLVLLKYLNRGNRGLKGKDNRTENIELELELSALHYLNNVLFETRCQHFILS